MAGKYGLRRRSITAFGARPLAVLMVAPVSAACALLCAPPAKCKVAQPRAAVLVIAVLVRLATSSMGSPTSVISLAQARPRALSLSASPS